MIETRMANRAKSIFSAFGTIVNDFYLEAGIYFVGGFNASLVAWDIYTNLMTAGQPLPYAIALAVIAFITVEGLAVYLVGASAKTNNGLLWFFSVVFAGFFTIAHYRQMMGYGDISGYITLAIPFFVVIGYWARTVKVDVENAENEFNLQRENELARKQRIEDEERTRKQKIEDDRLAHEREIERVKQANQQAVKMARLAKKAPNDTSFDTSFDTNDDTSDTSNMDAANDARKLTRDARMNRIIELAPDHSQSEIADILNVSISTIKRDYKQMNAHHDINGSME